MQTAILTRAHTHTHTHARAHARAEARSDDGHVLQSADSRAQQTDRTVSRMPFSELYFNVDNGYLEGLVRGFKAGILTQADYLNLVQCETLEGEPHQRAANG